MADATVTPDVEIDENEVVEEAASKGTTDVVKAIQGLNNPDSAFYSSLKGADFASKKIIAAALTSSTPVDDMLGQVIQLANYVVAPVELTNAETGEVNTAPRVILIDADNKAYHATSVGLLTFLRNLNSVLGEPDAWDEPIAVKIVEQKGNNGFKFFTGQFA